MTQAEISAQVGVQVATTMTTTLVPIIKGKLGEKQDKETGKGLSTEDFTSEYKAMLDNAVIGVKGDKESVYRTGNVNVTPANIGAVPVSSVGSANGVAELDASGKVLSSQLPSYVDDVLEYASVSAFPATGESGKIYVATDANLTYRWTGSAYTEISPSLALGETSSTAYRGDRGKTAYDHSQTTGNAHNMVKADIGLGNVDNTSDLSKPVSTAQQAALDLKVDKVSGKSLSTNDYTDADKAKVAAALTQHQDISGKVDKVTGKGLSTNDYTDADKAKVAAALTQHQDISGKVDKVTGKGLSTNDYTTAEKNKLSGIEAQANKTIIDATLSNTGQAADAKTTGDSFSALHGLISRMEIHCEASGNPATFSDAKAANVKDLRVTVTPTQSGSGDPYPPGGGKNLLDTSVLETVTSNGVTFQVSKNAAGSVTEIKANGTPTATNSRIYMNIPDGSIYSGMILSGCPANSNSSLILELAGSPYTVYGTDTGNGITIADIPSNTRVNLIWRFPQVGTAIVNAKCYPMIRRASDTDPTFAPYSNVRPISGVSSVSVTRMGKNQCPLEATSDTINGVAFTVNQSTGTVTVNGTASATTVFYLNDLSDRYTGENWILSGCPAGGNFATYCLKMFVHPGNGYVSDIGSGVQFSGIDNLKCAIVIYNGVSASNLVFRPMIRRASDTNATFEPYQGQTVTVSLTDGSNPLTVYGGTLDMTTGVLTVDCANIASYNGETLPGRWISDRDVYASGATPTTGAQVVYELATPLTYQLTLQQLATLHGYNTVSTDAGSVSVTYKADPVLSLGGGT